MSGEKTYKGKTLPRHCRERVISANGRGEKPNRWPVLPVHSTLALTKEGAFSPKAKKGCSPLNDSLGVALHPVQLAPQVLQREKESKLKKKKAMETALAGLEKETEDFQKEKQNALNQIDFVLTLYMHQLEHLTDGKLPEDLSETLVFSNAVINELKETIKDHGSESAALRKLQKELKKEHITLVRERKSRECKIRELEQRVTDVQMLKFGQMIDLEVLDTMSAKKDNEELKLELKTQEAQNAKEVAKWNRIIDDSIDQIARAMKEHTACLHVTADLQENIQLLNKTMKQKAGSPYRDVFVEKKKAELEYDHLCKVVTVQKQRMEQLKQDLKDIQKEKRKLFP